MGTGTRPLVCPGSERNCSTASPFSTRVPSSRGCSRRGDGSRRRPAILHEAALGYLSRGDVDRAHTVALRAALMSPLDENHQALLIRLYRLAGEDDAAERQYAAWSATAQRELGTAPGAAVLLALRERRLSS